MGKKSKAARKARIKEGPPDFFKHFDKDPNWVNPSSIIVPLDDGSFFNEARRRSDELMEAFSKKLLKDSEVSRIQNQFDKDLKDILDE